MHAASDIYIVLLNLPVSQDPARSTAVSVGQKDTLSYVPILLIKQGWANKDSANY